MECDHVEVIISRLEWEALLKGQSNTLRIFRESDLHLEFGDDPEAEIVRVRISKLRTWP